MAANIVPIFPLVPVVAWGTILTANTAKDGTGTTSTIFTAGADGAIVQRVRASALGTNTASVLRIFVNNGSTPATATNNTLFAEISLPGTTLSEVGSLIPIDVPLNLPLPAGYRLLAAIGTTVAAGWAITAVGGSF